MSHDCLKEPYAFEILEPSVKEPMMYLPMQNPKSTGSANLRLMLFLASHDLTRITKSNKLLKIRFIKGGKFHRINGTAKLCANGIP